MFWLNRNKVTPFVILFIILLSIPAVFSLLKSGYFQSDDGEWMVIRFSAFYQDLREGQFPVRFLGRLNYGYGYPVANFLYPGFMYLGVPFKIAGFSFISTLKILFGISLVGSGILCYLWLSQFFTRYASVIGALFYIYTPYHLFDLYKRGSIGEMMALLFLPFILFCIEKRNMFLVSVGIFLLILSHNTLSLLFLPLLFLYMLLRKKEPVKKILITFLFGFLLSSFFIIPAILELSYTRFSETQVSNFREYFASISLIGLSSISVMILAIIFFLRKTKKKEVVDKKIVLLFLLVIILSIVFSTRIGESIWSVIPSTLIQFPFRVLSYTILSVSFLAAYIISSVQRKIQIILTVFLFLVVSFSALPFLKANLSVDHGDEYYTTNEATTTVQDEYMPWWVKEKPHEHFKNKVEIVKGNSKIENVTYSNKIVTFSSISETEGVAQVNTIYYPGWTAYIDNSEEKILFENKRGVIQVVFPPGKHEAKLVFGETMSRLFADFISVVSFLGLIIYTKRTPRKKST